MSDDAGREAQNAVPLLGVRFAFHPPKLYRFANALEHAKDRIGVWRIQAYYTPEISIAGDNTRRPPHAPFPWQRGYYYGVVGQQVFEGTNPREIHHCLDVIARSKGAWNADHELWWFAIAPKWELASFRKTIILDALEEE